MELKKRPLRLRKSQVIRNLVGETELGSEDLIAPIFITHVINRKEAVKTLPEQFRYSTDRICGVIEEYIKKGIKSFLLFGIPANKDEVGQEAKDPGGPVPEAVRKIKREFPEVLLISDICLCAYLMHGHCGVMAHNEIDSEASLSLMGDMALVHAMAGVDMVAPSAMLDGQVLRIRNKLDEEGFTLTGIMAYSVKYRSNFYGPFREAAQSAPLDGDRSAYQLDFRNRREAIREALLDEEEGADILMVKPALSYLDIIFELKQNSSLPLAAYNVSGEYAMIKAAARQGWIQENLAALELLTSIKRAGADMIITYFAKDFHKYR